MPKEAKASGVIFARSNDLFVLQPGTLGFSAMITPEPGFGGVGLKFSAQAHYNEAQVERMGDLCQSRIVALWPLFLKELDKTNAKLRDLGKPLFKASEFKMPEDAREWVEEHLKAANEKSRNQDPFFKFSNDADYKDKDGTIHRKVMRAWSSKGELLDLPKLNPGMGSVVQVVVTPSLFVSTGLRIEDPTLSLKLQGLRIISLQSRGGHAGGNIAATQDDELVGVDEDVVADDLSQFIGNMTATSRPDAKALPVDTFEEDEEIPF